MASTASKGRKKTPAKTGRGGAKGGKQKTTRKPSAAELQAQSAITSEIILIGVLALTILLFLCNFGVIGVIGNQISRVMFGIFGTMAYALPVLAFIAIAFGISNQGNRIASMKLTAGIVLFFLLGVVCSLLFQEGTLSMDYSIRELYLESAEKRLGGGVISGSLAWALHRLLGMVGTVLLLLVLVIICTVIITERSFVNGVKTSGRYVYETARSDAQRYRERSERRRKENEERYEQRRQANEERSERLRQENEERYERRRRENEERTQKRREEELAREKERKQLARQKQLNAEQQREAKQRRKEEAQARQDAEQIFRMEKKSTGIMADTTLRKAPVGRREDMHEITITENPGQVTEQYTARPVNVNLDADRRNETFPDAAAVGGAAVLATSSIITSAESIPAPAVDASGSAFMSHVRIHSAYLNKDSDTTPVPQDNTAEPADAFLSGTQAPVTSQLQADVYQDMKEVHYLEPKQPQQTETFVPLESAVETSAVETPAVETSALETSAPDVTLHTDTQPVCASEKIAPVQELVQSDSDKYDAVPPELPWDDNMDAAEEPTVLPAQNLQSTGVQRPKAVPPKAPQTAAEATVVGQELAKKQKEQEKQAAQQPPKPVVYHYPPLSLLHKSNHANNMDSECELKETAKHLEDTLQTFGVKVTVTDISQGPTVTRYELQPDHGVKVSKILSLADDIKLNLAATDIRIEAPIPGKAAIGIEVPNKETMAVGLRELLETDAFSNFPSKIAFAVGKDIAGKVVVSDIAKMPHMLIAGSTGSGKSVCINTLIMSILYKAKPSEVKLILVDPKVVELSVYNGIPHLLIPVVTDPKKASAALQWGVAEMTDRYQKFADSNVRDLKGYNKKLEERRQKGEEGVPNDLPQIVIIVDELADLMMVAPGEVEEAICRLAQLARAAGIHLIIATQRPSVDVITGLIKANMPSRVAFAVSSGVDSRTILDMNGAEKLLGKGDMLFYPQGYSKPVRVQGAFVSDNEVSDVVDFLKNQNIGNVYDTSNEIEEKMKSIGTSSGSAASGSSGPEYDAYFADAGRFIIEKDKASIGMLQRVFKIGFNRAARLMDQLAEVGVVGEEEGTKPRKVLMTETEFEQLVEEIL